MFNKHDSVRMKNNNYNFTDKKSDRYKTIFLKYKDGLK